MSKPQPDNKSNFIQTLLLMAVVFMGFQIWQQTQGPKASTDTRPSSELWQKMLVDNRDALDVTIVKDAADWERQFRAESDKKKLPAAEVDTEIVKSHVLMADTRMKSAQYWPANAHDKIQKAYDILKLTYERDNDTPAWDAKVIVNPDEHFSATELTARSLYEGIVKDLALRNHTEKVYGLFPGFPVIDFLVKLTGRNPGFSYAFAAFFLALVVRSAVWPLSQRQYIWGRRMQQLQPMLKELEAKHRSSKRLTRL